MSNESLTAVSLTGKQMAIRTWLASNWERLLQVAGGTAVAVLAIIGVAGLADIWGDEAVRTLPPGLSTSGMSAEQIQSYPVTDQSGSIDYVPLAAGLFLLPAGMTAAGLYGRKFQHETKQVAFVDKSNVPAFERFTTTKDNYSALDPVWIGAVQICREIKEEIAKLLQTMDGPFTSSMTNCFAIAKRMEVHTGETYQYLYPALRMKNSHENRSLLVATEEMAQDVKLLRELLSVCSQLYVQSHFNSGHNQILEEEIKRISSQIDAVRETNASALPQKASAGNMAKPKTAITDGSEKEDMIADFKAKRKANRDAAVASA